MSDAQHKLNTPPRPVRQSATERHELERIRPNTRVKPKNSVALPGIDTRAEIEQIGQGGSQRVGDIRYRINGRIYFQKPDGAMYPEIGDGIVQLTNPQFRTLRLLIQHDGRTVGFNRATERDRTIRESDIELALNLFQFRKGK